MQTELVLSRCGFPPFSARGCQQMLQPMITGELRRTVNGSLMYTGKRQHHKYMSTIECHDQASLALEGIWRGELITVDCIQRLWQEVVVKDKIDAIRTTLDRPAVENSVLAMRSHNDSHLAYLLDPLTAEINGSFRSGDKIYLSYRPQLQMRITKFQITTDEWRQACGWRLDLEEV